MFPATTKQESALRSWFLASAMTGLTILGARIALPLPMTPVPLTFQVFAVLLSGLALGSRWGAVAQIQYLLLGTFSAPVFAHGYSGSAVLFGITGGYLLSYPLAAFATGWVVEGTHSREKKLAQKALATATGLIIIYSLGCIWLSVATRTSLLQTIFQGAIVFLAWDSVKAVLAIGSTEIADRLKLKRLR